MDIVLERPSHHRLRRVHGPKCPARAHIPPGRQGRLLVKPPVHPERFLPIPNAKSLVVPVAPRRVRRDPTRRQVPSRFLHLDVVVHQVHPLALRRRRHQRQRHGRLQDVPRIHHVVEQPPCRRLLPQHPERRHARALVRAEVADQHEWQGGEITPGHNVEVVPQGPTLTANHHGVLLVGIVSRQRTLVLVIDRALRHQAVHPPGSRVARQHDLTGRARILDRVAADRRRPRYGHDANARLRPVPTEPPHLKLVPARDRVHGDNRSLRRRIEPTHKRVHIGPGMVRVPGRNPHMARHIPIAGRGTQLALGCHHTVPDVDRPAHEPRAHHGLGEHQRLVRPVPCRQVRHQRPRPVPRFQVHVQPREHPLEVQALLRAISQQRPMRGPRRGQVRVEKEVRRDLGPLLIQRILVQQRGNVLLLQSHRRLLRLVLAVHQRPHVMAVTRGVLGPSHVISGQHPGPPQALLPGLHPKHQHVVQVPRLPRRIQRIGLVVAPGHRLDILRPHRRHHLGKQL